MRKHPHRNHGPWEFDEKSKKWVRIPTRRAHGIFKDVRYVPGVHARALKREHLYMHSHKRRALAAGWSRKSAKHEPESMRDQ